MTTPADLTASLRQRRAYKPSIKTPSPLSPLSTDSANNDDTGDNEDGINVEFPVHLLPPVMATIAREASAAALVPASLTAACALGTVAAAIGAGLVVNSGGDRQTRSNLFILPVAASGTGKGRAYAEIVRPMAELERQRCDEWRRDKLPELEADLAILEKEADKNKTAAVNAPDGQKRSEHRQKLKECNQSIDRIKGQINEPILTVDNITQEALADGLAKASNEALASMSAEARGAVDVLAGRYNAKTDESLYLSGYSGDGVKVNRKGSPAIVLRKPCLTVLWLMQPDKLDEILGKRSLTDSGFLPRCLIFDTKADAQFAPETPHKIGRESRDHWQELILQLVDTYHEKKGEPLCVQSEPGVEPLLRSYYNEVVARRRKAGDLADVGSYAARWGEQAWRLAVVLHAGRHGHTAHQHDLSEQTARDAIELAQWFAVEQLAILHTGRETRKRERLDVLLGHLSPSGMTMRNLRIRHGFQREEVEMLVHENSHRITIEKIKTGRAGQPSETVKAVA
jgi:hypothetical protein